jgi:CRP-like cAMP-binding protein
MIKDRRKADAPVACTFCSLAGKTLYSGVYLKDAAGMTNARSRVLSYPGGSIVDIHTDASTLLTLENGLAYSFLVLADGRRQVFNIFIPGDVIPIEFVLLPLKSVPYSVRTATDARFCVLDKKLFLERLAGCSATESAIKAAAASYVENLHYKIVTLGQRSASGRIAQFLIDICNRVSARDGERAMSFDLSIRQDVIADALGITNVYVSRTLMSLRKAGLIAIAGPTIRILDYDALERASNRR